MDQTCFFEATQHVISDSFKHFSGPKYKIIRIHKVKRIQFCRQFWSSVNKRSDPTNYSKDVRIVLFFGPEKCLKESKITCWVVSKRQVWSKLAFSKYLQHVIKIIQKILILIPFTIYYRPHLALNKLSLIIVFKIITILRTCDLTRSWDPVWSSFTDISTFWNLLSIWPYKCWNISIFAFDVAFFRCATYIDGSLWNIKLFKDCCFAFCHFWWFQNKIWKKDLNKIQPPFDLKIKKYLKSTLFQSNFSWNIFSSKSSLHTRCTRCLN